MNYNKVQAGRWLSVCKRDTLHGKSDNGCLSVKSQCHTEHQNQKMSLLVFKVHHTKKEKA